MAELLRRSLSPITAEGWKEIDKTTAEVLRTQLTARSLIDFDGPHAFLHTIVAQLAGSEVPTGGVA